MLVPLADMVRPKSLDEVVGQRHILGKGKVLYNLIQKKNVPNMIFYGRAARVRPRSPILLQIRPGSGSISSTRQRPRSVISAQS